MKILFLCKRRPQRKDLLTRPYWRFFTSLIGSQNVDMKSIFYYGILAEKLGSKYGIKSVIDAYDIAFPF